MHGPSGLSEAEYRECINRGVRKINYYTYADKQSFETVQTFPEDNPETFISSDLTVPVSKAVEDNLDVLVNVLCENVIKK